MDKEEVKSSPDEDILHNLRIFSVSELSEVDLGDQHAITYALLCQERDLADECEVARYFGPPRIPGTTSIGYRQRNPEIFQDSTESIYETFPDWIHRSISKILAKMKAKNFLPADAELTDEYTDDIVQKIRQLLEFETYSCVPLSEVIPQQLYEDVFIRMVVFLTGEEVPGNTINFYKEFNSISHRIVLVLLDKMENDSIIGMSIQQITKIIQIAVLSGYVGINLKSSASAASKLLNRNLIPIKEDWIQSIEEVKAVSSDDLNSVAEKLLAITNKSEGQFGLESLSQYQKEVIQTDVPTLLVFFCDDYLESVLDIKRFEIMVDANPHLKVLFIPRSGRFGNDIAYEDVDSILQERQFWGLHKHIVSGRFYVSPNGPKSGCIDPRFFGRKLINEIDSLGDGERIIFETKGCRNFEMLQGNLQIPWYAGFNCNRALSIRTVGIDGPPVFLRIPPGLKAYDHFTQFRIGPSPSYPNSQIRFARMTTKQLYAALKSDLYQFMLSYAKDELNLNSNLTKLGEFMDMPFSELISFLGDPFLPD